MTADAIGRPVVVGPFEATAMGNVLVQAMATNEVRDVTHLRRIVAGSFDLVTYQPASGCRLGLGCVTMRRFPSMTCHLT